MSKVQTFKQTILKTNQRIACDFATVGESLTHQAAKDECDVNKIMEKYLRNGIIDHRNTYEGQYGDFTDAPETYQESLQAVMDAETMFNTLPAKIRDRFAHDPQQFIEFVGDPNNAEEMIEMGLATPNQDDVDVIERPKKAEKKTSEKPDMSQPKGDKEE